MKNGKQTPVVILGVEGPGRSGYYAPEGYFHVRAHVGRLVRPEDDSFHRGNEFISPEMVNGMRVRDLVLSSQGDNKCAHLYGYEDAEYLGVHSAGLSDMELMVRTLRGVVKKMRRAQEVHGYARSYGQQVTRFAQALGAKRVYWRASDDGDGIVGGDDKVWLSCAVGEESIAVADRIADASVRRWGGWGGKPEASVVGVVESAGVES